MIKIKKALTPKDLERIGEEWNRILDRPDFDRYELFDYAVAMFIPILEAALVYAPKRRRR